MELTAVVRKVDRVNNLWIRGGQLNSYVGTDIREISRQRRNLGIVKGI